MGRGGTRLWTQAGLLQRNKHSRPDDRLRRRGAGSRRFSFLSIPRNQCLAPRRARNCRDVCFADRQRNEAGLLEVCRNLPCRVHFQFMATAESKWTRARIVARIDHAFVERGISIATGILAGRSPCLPLAQVTEIVTVIQGRALTQATTRRGETAINLRAAWQ